MNKFFILTAVSGAGKTTVINNIFKKGYQELQYVPSYSTRPMRPNEEQGSPYYFISQDEFQDMIDKGEFLEYARVHNMAYYGTNLKSILKPLKQWKNIIKEIEIQWVKQIVDNDLLDKDIYEIIFIDLNEKELTRRIVQRWNITEQELANRIQSSKKERAQADDYAHHIINWDRTQQEMVQVITDIIFKR